MTRDFALRKKWDRLDRTGESSCPEHRMVRNRETTREGGSPRVNAIESQILPQGTYEIQVWDTRFSEYGWQSYYGAYLFHRKKLGTVLQFIKEHCFFCHDLNDKNHTEMQIKNVRTGVTMPFSLLFAMDSEYHECQKARRERNR